MGNPVKGSVTSVIAIVVAMVMFPLVIYYTTPANVNATGQLAQLLPILPLFYVLGLVIGVLKSYGMI